MNDLTYENGFNDGFVAAAGTADAMRHHLEMGEYTDDYRSAYAVGFIEFFISLADEIEAQEDRVYETTN